MWDPSNPKNLDSMTNGLMFWHRDLGIKSSNGIWMPLACRRIPLKRFMSRHHTLV